MGLIHHTAICLDCGWRCDEKNAQGIGQVHANTKDHRVEVQTGYLLTRKAEYTPPRTYRKVRRP